MNVFEFVIDENDINSGMKAISIVGEPAIESNFLIFDKEENKTKYINLSTEGYKQVLGGLALIPDIKIKRINKITGEEYLGYFSKETIEKIRNKFHKELQLNNINVNHNANDKASGYLIESYIIDSEDRLNEVLNKGIKEVCIGSWYVAYKIEDNQVFEKALKGEVNGFSIEIFLEKILKIINNENKYSKMKSNIKTFFSKLNDLINNFEDIPITFVDAEGKDNVKYQYTKVGEPVLKVLENDVTEPVVTGEVELKDGSVLVIGEDGNLKEIKEVKKEDTPAPAPVEKPALQTQSKENNEFSKLNLEVDNFKKEIEKLKKDNEELSKLVKENEDLKKEVEKLKKLPIAEPVELSKTSNFSKKEDLKTEKDFKNNLDWQLYKLELTK